MQFLQVLLGAALVSVLTAACSVVAGGASDAPVVVPRTGGPAAPVPVTGATAAEKVIPVDIQAIGTVDSLSTVQVHAQITGELTSVGFKEGEDVKQGQVLFTLDRRPLEAALQQAEAALARDTA